MSFKVKQFRSSGGTSVYAVYYTAYYRVDWRLSIDTRCVTTVFLISVKLDVQDEPENNVNTQCNKKLPTQIKSISVHIYFITSKPI